MTMPSVFQLTRPKIDAGSSATSWVVLLDQKTPKIQASR
jgi:hypothetical protein